MLNGESVQGAQITPKQERNMLAQNRMVDWTPSSDYGTYKL